MEKLSIRAIGASAVVIGLVVGVGGAFLLNDRSGKDARAVLEARSSEVVDPKDLPVEVLKALPPEQLAEMFPEKAEAILAPEAFGQIKSAGGDSDDPEYLRAVLEKLGIQAPGDATTKELQDMLANARQDPVAGK